MVERGVTGGVRARRLGLALAALAGGFVLLAVIASIVEHGWYSGRVLPGVHLDGARVAGKKRVQASDAVTRLAADLDRTPIRVRAGERHFTAEPTIIGFDLDVAATARRAERAGRAGNPIAVVLGTLVRRVRPDRIAPVVRYDSARLEGLLDGWANAVDRDVVEGGLRFEGANVVPIEPHAGFGLQRDLSHRQLVRALARTDRAEVALPLGVVVPRVDRAHVDAAAARARALLSTNDEIDADGTRVVLTAAQLAATLGTRIDGGSLALTIDTAKLRVQLGLGVARFEQPAVDASFSISSSNTVSVVPSRDGRELDLDAISRDILGGARVIVAHVSNVHPAHDTAWARRLGIREQVSTFTTQHPAGQPRVHNIHIAADVLDNTVVEPGKLFSLNEKLGPRTPEKGYVKAPILVEDGFGEDYGGGVSQLTTTLFNAVFFGGYEDVEHSPHHFYISRYPMGREATINYPSVDLKFRNDTAHGVLIRTSYSATSITVTFYGDNEGRTVREANRKILHVEPITDEIITCPVKKPPDDPNNDCATLTALQRTTAQAGETGYDVELDRVIDQPGRAERRQHYEVHYPMLPNKVLVGTTPPPSSSSSTPAAPSSTTKTTLRHR